MTAQKIPEWTGNFVGKRHNAGITNKQVAEKLQLSEEYISRILKGKDTPPNAEQRLNQALDELIAQQQNKKAPR